MQGKVIKSEIHVNEKLLKNITWKKFGTLIEKYLYIFMFSLIYNI